MPHDQTTPRRSRRTGVLVAVIALALALLAACQTPPGGAGSAADMAALRRVVEVFRTSIIHKDKAAFMGLFFSDKPELVTWQGVVDDPSLAMIQATRPQATKARHRPDNNFVAFIEGIVASQDTAEETFSNLHIDTDGEVASVSFDYVYLENAKPANSGREKWLLVRTEQGWKITSVVYTVRLARPAGSP